VKLIQTRGRKREKEEGRDRKGEKGKRKEKRGKDERMTPNCVFCFARIV
jgi:hypothetical protein